MADRVLLNSGAIRGIDNTPATTEPVMTGGKRIGESVAPMTSNPAKRQFQGI